MVESNLPLPPDTPEEPLEFTSVIFDRVRPKEVFSISSEAVTPFWLNRKLYTKLNVDVEFSLEP